MTNLYIDIMLNGSFYSQLKIADKPEYDNDEIEALVLSKYPSLKCKSYSIEFSNQKV